MKGLFGQSDSGTGTNGDGFREKSISWNLEECITNLDCIIREIEYLDARYVKQFPEPPKNELDWQRENRLRSALLDKGRELSTEERRFNELAFQFVSGGYAQEASMSPLRERMGMLQEKLIMLNRYLLSKYPPEK